MKKGGNGRGCGWVGVGWVEGGIYIGSVQPGLILFKFGRKSSVDALRC